MGDLLPSGFSNKIAGAALKWPKYQSALRRGYFIAGTFITERALRSMSTHVRKVYHSFTRNCTMYMYLKKLITGIRGTKSYRFCW